MCTDGTCVDIKSDNKNCGACGAVCTAGEALCNRNSSNVSNRHAALMLLVVYYLVCLHTCHYLTTHTCFLADLQHLCDAKLIGWWLALCMTA
jgi:hypothetical protein